MTEEQKQLLDLHNMTWVVGPSQWSGQRMGVPNRDIAAEIVAIEAELWPDPVQRAKFAKCTPDRSTAAGW